MKAASSSEALVSVIIPTYRRAQVVRLAAQSALEQTWQHLEVLVVSDGPDLQTRAAVSDLDPRLRYIELDRNQGPAAARNAGFQACRGTWLAFLDDDDWMLPEKIERQMRLADAAHPNRMIACRALYKVGEEFHPWPRAPLQPDQDLADYLLRRPSLLRRPGVVPIQSLLVHRSILEKVPFTSHKDHEDWAWLLEAWHLAGARVEFSWEPLVVYKVDTEAMSRSRRLNWADSVAFVEAYRKWIGDRPYCSFLCTKAALKAKREGDWKGLKLIASKVLRNRPSAIDLMFLLGIALLPGPFLQGAWKRSLRAAPAKDIPASEVCSVKTGHT